MYSVMSHVVPSRHTGVIIDRTTSPRSPRSTTPPPEPYPTYQIVSPSEHDFPTNKYICPAVPFPNLKRCKPSITTSTKHPLTTKPTTSDYLDDLPTLTTPSDRWGYMSSLAGDHRQDPSILDISNRTDLSPEVLRYGVPPAVASVVKELRYDGTALGEHDLPSFLDVIQTVFPQLKELTSVAPPKRYESAKEQAAAKERTRMRRLYVLYRIPCLVAIDGKSVSSEERLLARPTCPNGVRVERRDWLTKAMAEDGKQMQCQRAYKQRCQLGETEFIVAWRDDGTGGGGQGIECSIPVEDLAELKSDTGASSAGLSPSRLDGDKAEGVSIARTKKRNSSLASPFPLRFREEKRLDSLEGKDVVRTRASPPNANVENCENGTGPSMLFMDLRKERNATASDSSSPSTRSPVHRDALFQSNSKPRTNATAQDARDTAIPADVTAESIMFMDFKKEHRAKLQQHASTAPIPESNDKEKDTLQSMLCPELKNESNRSSNRPSQGTALSPIEEDEQFRLTGKRSNSFKLKSNEMQQTGKAMIPRQSRPPTSPASTPRKFPPPRKRSQVRRRWRHHRRHLNTQSMADEDDDDEESEEEGEERHDGEEDFLLKGEECDKDKSKKAYFAPAGSRFNYIGKNSEGNKHITDSFL